MNKLVILSDSTCDLPGEYLHENEIEYAQMLLSWTDKEGNFREIPARLEWDIINKDDYYEIIRSGTRIYSAQVPDQDYRDLFKKHLDKGNDVLYIGCSGKLSASVVRAEVVARELREQYPKQKLLVIDSLRASMGLGLQVMKAVDMRKEGKSIDEIYDAVMNYRNCCWEIGTPDVLDYLKRSGRITASKAFFGNLFKLKPILIFDKEGYNTAVEKAKGRKSAFKRIAEMAKEASSHPEDFVCYLMEAACSEQDIQILKNDILAICPFKEVKVWPLGPIIGTSSGPGTIIIYFEGDKQE